MRVDEPFITLIWTDRENGSNNYQRTLTLDYSEVLFGVYAPSSAAEVQTLIEALQDKAWDDIIAMFGSYVPYTGATGDVDLGTFGLTTDFVAFSQSPTVGPGNAQIGYNGQTQALAYDFNSSGVRCNIGQQMFAFVKNDEAFTINKGEAVYLFSASGNKATVKLASNTSDSTSDTALGLAAEDILSGQNQCQALCTKQFGVYGNCRKVQCWQWSDICQVGEWFQITRDSRCGPDHHASIHRGCADL